ncbi:MAG: 6-phosphofructokinase [Ruminococcaceae bacterium]|nr:6-phosphofructokinase [Oscillospiraceae bacterium]
MADKKFKRIGVLTSGGDAPGMNAAVRSVVRTAIQNGVEVMGIIGGYRGLVENDMKLLDARDVANIINHGGTMLFTDRCLEFKEESGLQKAVATCRENKIDGLVCIGGDGTFRGAQDLTRRGIPCIGIPGTIDNDISATDYTIGYDTAMNTVVDLVDKLRDTCESHARCNVVEVMGRNAGYIAINTGLATGAVGIAIEEFPFDLDGTIEKMKELKKAKKRNFIVIVSEAFGNEYSENLAKRIEKETEIETKFARLAHVQRGGRPTLRDRELASLMGYKAVELLLDGKSNLVVCIRDEVICGIDIEYALTYDKLCKGKIKAEDITGYSQEQVAKMVADAKIREDRMRTSYEIASKISI